MDYILETIYVLFIYSIHLFVKCSTIMVIYNAQKYSLCLMLQHAWNLILKYVPETWNLSKHHDTQQHTFRLASIPINKSQIFSQNLNEH